MAMNAPGGVSLNPAGEKLARLAVALILGNESESPDPQNDPRGDAGRLRAALADVLRGASPFHPGRHSASRRSAAAARQVEALGEVAGQLSLGPEIGRGGEHIVHHTEGRREVQKLTLPDTGGYGFVPDVDGDIVWLRPAIASEYLGRLGLMDAVFGVPSRVTGILTNHQGAPQIASSQPWVDGIIPESDEVSDWLHEQGFAPVPRRFHERGSVPAGSVWYRRTDDILMGDAVPRNFLKTPDGIIVPIDVSLTLIPVELIPGAMVGAESDAGADEGE